MTAREKLKLEYPEAVIQTAIGGCRGCPMEYGYLEDQPWYCRHRDENCEKVCSHDEAELQCNYCWDREIPATKFDDIPEITSTFDKDGCEVLGIVEKDAAALSTTKIICLSGKAQNGKDSTAQFLKEALEQRGKKVLIAHYGDLVKYVCKTFFDWNGEKDEAGRTLLQYIGTDIIRKRTPNYWINFILSILKHFPDEWDYVLIPDCRFPNELDGIKNAGWDMMHIRVVRSGNGFVSPLTEEQQNHISETALDNVKPDCLVLNYGTLDDLRNYVYKLAEYLKGA